jgi:hypothetical protein
MLKMRGTGIEGLSAAELGQLQKKVAKEGKHNRPPQTPRMTPINWRSRLSRTPQAKPNARNFCCLSSLS